MAELLLDLQKHNYPGIHVRVTASTCRYLGRWLLEIATWAEEQTATRNETDQCD